MAGSVESSARSPRTASFFGVASNSNVKRNSKSIPGTGRDSSLVRFTSIAANLEMISFRAPGR